MLSVKLYILSVLAIPFVYHCTISSAVLGKEFRAANSSSKRRESELEETEKELKVELHKAILGGGEGGRDDAQKVPTFDSNGSN